MQSLRGPLVRTLDQLTEARAMPTTGTTLESASPRHELHTLLGQPVEAEKMARLFMNHKVR